jgi:hypothetical protein
MAIIIREKAEGGPVVTSKPPTAKNSYICWGDNVALNIEQELKAYLPLTLAIDGCTLHRKTISIERQGKADDIWEATCEWGLKVAPIVFDTTGGTTKVTQPLYRRGRYPSALCSNLNLQAPADMPIGETNDGEPQGCEITIPQFSWSETVEFNISFVDFAYAMTLYGLTGKVNNASFRGFAAGEVLFLGASGGRQKDETLCDIQFNFAASPNVTGLTVEPISGIAKYGWDYLWIKYEENDNGGIRYKAPIAAIVDQVYPTGDFSLLGIGTSI